MKWWYWLVLELLIIFGVIAWIYFFPSEFEYDFAKGMIGFVLIYAIEKYRDINKRKTMTENYTVEQNTGENRIEDGVVSISGSAKVYTCKDCLRHQFCYLAKERKDEACMKISLYKETDRQYRPFKDCNELIEHYQKKYKSAVGCDIYFPSLYKPAVWVREKDTERDSLIVEYAPYGVTLGGEINRIGLQELFDNYTYLDGSPVGMEE